MSMSKGTVLVVDDDAAIIDVLAQALTLEGYDVLSAVNGAALQTAREHQPQVILLDLTMPHMDGVEVSRRLRADPATASIPIIAMSALASSAELMQADGCLRKPFRLEHLYAVVAQCAGRAKALPTRTAGPAPQG